MVRKRIKSSEVGHRVAQKWGVSDATRNRPLEHRIVCDKLHHVLSCVYEALLWVLTVGNNGVSSLIAPHECVNYKRH
jgi:hypothetical protein